MATAPQQGIMALPENDEVGKPTLSLEDSYDASKSALQEVAPKAASDMDAVIAQLRPQLENLTDDQIDQMIAILRSLHDHPENYEKAIKDLISTGQLEAGDLPEKYDPAFLAVAMSLLMETKRSRKRGGSMPMAQAPMPPQQQFARGGIADAAQSMAAQGRFGDSMLAHISPREADLLRAHGGAATINPATGLPEYWNLFKAIGDAFKSIGNAVKSVLNSTVGRLIATVALAAFLGPGAFGITGLGLSAGVAGAAASGLVTLGAGGSLKDAFKAAAMGYFSAPGGPVSSYVSSAIGGATSLTGTALNMATSGVIGTAGGLLSGQKLSDAVRGGLTSAAITGAMSTAPAQSSNMAPVENRDFSMSPAISQTYTGNTGPIFQAPVPTAADFGSGGGGADISSNGGGGGGGGTSSGAAPAPVPAPVPVSDVKFESNPNYRAPIPAGTVEAPQVVSAGDAASKMLGLGDNELSFKNFKEGAGELFSPGLSKAQLELTPEYKGAMDKGYTPAQALKQAAEANNPGILRSYGPGVAAGIAALGATGGFSGKPATMSPEAAAMLANIDAQRKDIIANPWKYTPQGTPGAKYDSKGNIIGIQAWSPTRVSLKDTTVETPRLYSHGGIAAHFADGGSVDPNDPAALRAAIQAGPQTQDALDIAMMTYTPAQLQAAFPEYGRVSDYNSAVQEAQARQEVKDREARRADPSYVSVAASAPKVSAVPQSEIDASKAAAQQAVKDGTLSQEDYDFLVWRTNEINPMSQQKVGEDYARQGSNPYDKSNWAMAKEANATAKNRNNLLAQNGQAVQAPDWTVPGYAARQAQRDKDRAARDATIAAGQSPNVVVGPSGAGPTGGGGSSTAGGSMDRASFSMAGGSMEKASSSTVQPPTLIHGNIYDPITGRFSNPTLSAQQAIDARDNVNTIPEMRSAYNSYFQTYKPGEVLNFAGGTLTMNEDGKSATHTYIDANGKQQSYVLSADGNFEDIAKNDPNIAAEWKSMFGYSVPTVTPGPVVVPPPKPPYTPPVGVNTSPPPVVQAPQQQGYPVDTTRLSGYNTSWKPAPNPWEGIFKPVTQTYNTNPYNFTAPAAKATGGIATLASKGYPRRTGQVEGPGTEKSDSIPAMLSDGEFVMTAKAVRGAGTGDRRAGAKKMYALMHQLEKNASRG